MKTQPFFCALLLVAPLSAQALPAFLGAEGGGAESVGGRGGAVCQVTNLNDSGPGSLRSCVEMSGPRMVVFRVGGTIKLLSDLIIRNPYITIAGQTAPGGGIQISGKSSTKDIFSIRTHNVIIRYLRLRKGYNSNTASQDGDVLNARLDAHNIIVDHCSLSWTQDENAGSGTWKDISPRNITYSWNIFSEPLKAHPANLLFGAVSGVLADLSKNIDIHHSLLANSGSRNPLVGIKSFRLVNNIIYNWSHIATELVGGVNIDIIGNIYKIGPLVKYDNRKPSVRVFPSQHHSTPTGDPSIFIKGNLDYVVSDVNSDNWIMIARSNCEGCSAKDNLSTQYRRNTPLPALKYPITAYPATQLESLVLPIVGASRRLDCMGNWISNRDAADARIIQEYHTNKGIIPTSEDEVGGFPVIAGGTPCVDSDGDGMPDVWEVANGLNSNDPSDGPLVGSDGYTNLERYLNGSDAKITTTVPKNLRIVQP